MKTSRTIACISFLVLSASCFAVPEFSNLSPAGTSYDPWYTLGLGYTQGFGFTATSSEKLTDVEIVLGNISGTGDASISLYSADSAWNKGSLLESWTVDHTSLIPSLGYKTTYVTTLVATSGAQLVLNSNYLLVGTNDANTNTAWYLNNVLDYSQPRYWQIHADLGQPPSIYLPNNGAGLSGAFAINAAPVPEAETYAMMMAGLGLIGLIARRRGKLPA